MTKETPDWAKYGAEWLESKLDQIFKHDPTTPKTVYFLTEEARDRFLAYGKELAEKEKESKP